MNALRILARVTGKSPGEVGTTTARPFVHPVPLSPAGRGFTPERRLRCIVVTRRWVPSSCLLAFGEDWSTTPNLKELGQPAFAGKLRQFAPVSGYRCDAGEIELWGAVPPTNESIPDATPCESRHNAMH